MTYFYSLFGYVLEFFYNIFSNNYILAIIAFTLITRIIFLPTYIPQQKSQAKQFRIQPKLQKLQQKFGNDRQKLQEEQQKLYSKEGFNPMSAGCLPMLVSLPLLWGVFGAITRPISYMLHFKDTVNNFLGMSGVSDLIKAAAENAKGSNYNELVILNSLNSAKGDLFNKINAVFTPAQIETMKNFLEHFKLFGLDLTQTPTISKPSIYWLIPILSGVTSFLTSFYSMQRQKKTNPAMAQAGNAMSNGCMLVMMPLFSLWIGFSVPTGVGFYWVISNVFALIQTMILSNLYAPPKVAAKNMIKDMVVKYSYEKSVKNRAAD